MQNLKTDKSPGPDGLHPRVLAELSTSLAVPLKLLFELSLTTGVLPTDWKTAYVSPIFKKGPKDDACNYRPVSLTSIVCKVLETLIKKALMNHLDSYNLLHDAQHGFIKGRSCSTQLLEALEDWTKALDEGDCVDVVYMDFQKAFDTVPHQRLLAELEGYSITGRLLDWIRSFLTGRKQAVTVNGARSDWTRVSSGIPQGSVLRPVLFVAYINDLPDNVTSTTKLFADDTKLYGVPTNTSSIQEDLDRLQDWSDTWLLKFHPDKCGVLRIGKRTPETSYTMKNGSDTITLKKLEVEKDLGVHIDRLLTFRTHIMLAVARANRF